MRQLPAGRVALVYLLLASLWVFLSDRWLAFSFPPPFNYHLSLVKGLGFVGLTALFLYLGLRRFRSLQARAEERIEHLNRMYALLAETNHALIRLQSPQPLLAAICRAAVEEGLFATAWAVLKGPGGSWELVAREGKEVPAFVPSFLTPPYQVINDLLSYKGEFPSKDLFLAQGIRTIAFLPLTANKDISGLLAFGAEKPGVFGKEELELMAQIAADISFGLEVLAHREQCLQVQEKLHHLVHHDPLTGLPHRFYLEDHLKQAVLKARRGISSALLVIDIDNFQLVNDNWGYKAGDRLLQAFARFLQENIREEDIIARVAGDKFMVLMEDVFEEEACKLAEELRRRVEEGSFELDGQRCRITVSAGISMVKGDEAAETVMSQADLALRRAKEEGRNRVVLFRPEEELLARLKGEQEVLNLLKEALATGRGLLLFLQPVVRLSDLQVVHYEALLRLRECNMDRYCSPAQFIPLAERFGLMPRLDRWVIEAALDILRAHPKLKLFVNLSGLSVGDDSLLEYLQAKLKEKEVDPSRLGFEVTETAAIRNLLRAERWLGRLKQLGCELALDDFGSGFSTFSYLRSLPVNYLKIDLSFIRGLTSDRMHRALVEAMNTVAHTLGKLTVAEGIENEETLRILQELGTDFGQGYYFGRPEPVEAIIARQPELAGGPDLPAAP
ncbi:diguanylate cyclase/phosphodiesterase with GAF sensor [Ammonifex degensii KC4]|uniref:Diguanylate cyclase/phosphodiesterase with GAF sensor n=1 Tax=Ammonifex degensii (strain DSM 10501 / KC4) TaxID=429009 RepID=C9R8T9_AMMDK|nr:EAL domain-containing protein [Ammonifex degensii]ACX52718.1 diguanylate cyclase/phosphodiesterase with GAF sensor [Ammonifex degensii KC4]